ncbi:MAG TPA: L,D-transpeptidase family protein [Chitinophagales bacterium]|nr:L,D-transpeptidase family protein [Chitinophagales bacterium]HNF67942.1 L,D-transpeptidase family protein [Chitinophagales bacterium]HNM07360.1 L,D-transpeptidase family protein [Chitinophagales bacterium]
MKWVTPIICFFVIGCSAPSVKQPQFKGGQMVEVVTLYETDTTGTMFLWERSDEKRPWRCVDTINVSVGRNGLAPADTTYLDHKREGDGCSPEGIFPLTRVFSYNVLNNLSMPFEQVDTNDLCVDDGASVYYNMLIDRDTAQINDYNSFETMHRKDRQYAFGVWVDYNTPAIAGNGSCIFLHIWSSPGHPTSGCTAMAESDMLKLIHWLDAKQFPILYQHHLKPYENN